MGAVNAHGKYGRWDYEIARNPTEVPALLERAAAGAMEGVPAGG